MAPPGPEYSQGPISAFPANDLRHAQRFVTTHNSSGQGVFLKDDDGAHHRVMVNGNAVANIIYSTKENPVDLNDEKDLIYARDNEVVNSSRPRTNGDEVQFLTCPVIAWNPCRQW